MTHLHSTASLRRGAIAIRLVAAVTVTLAIVGGVFAFTRDDLCCAPRPLTIDAPPEARPTDFSLDYRAHTGSVSPEYYHSWRLQVAGDGAARMSYVPGYAHDGPEWTASWTIAEPTRDSLWADFRRGALWMAQPEKPLSPDEIPIGGGSTALTVVAAGRTVELADDRRDAFAVPADLLVKRVAALIPDSLMQQFKARQAALPRP
jgi:hypothetical protein